MKSGVPVFRRWSPRGSAGLLRLELCVCRTGVLKRRLQLDPLSEAARSESQPVFQTLSREDHFSRLPGAWAEEQREARKFPRGDLRSPGVLALYRMFALGSVLRFKNYLGEL